MISLGIVIWLLRVILASMLSIQVIKGYHEKMKKENQPNEHSLNWPRKTFHTL